VGGTIYSLYSLEPLKYLGLDPQKVTKLAVKLRANSDQYAYKFDILRAFEGLRGCDTYTQAFLQGLPVWYSDFTADLRFRIRKVWRDIADMNPLESDNKLVTYILGLPAPS